MNIVEIEDYDPSIKDYNKQEFIRQDTEIKEESILDLLKTSQHLKEFLDSSEILNTNTNLNTSLNSNGIEFVNTNIVENVNIDEEKCCKDKKECCIRDFEQFKKEMNDQFGKVLEFFESKNNHHLAKIEENLISKIHKIQELEIELNILKSKTIIEINNTKQINNLDNLENQKDLEDCECKNKTLEDPSWTSFNFWKEEFIRKEIQIENLINENKDLRNKLLLLENKIQSNYHNQSSLEMEQKQSYIQQNDNSKNYYDKQKESLKGARSFNSFKNNLSVPFMPINLYESDNSSFYHNSFIYSYD